MLRRRMHVWAEIRWYIAAQLLNAIVSLTHREASPEMLEALATLAERFANDPRHDTQWMKSQQDD